MNPPAIGPEVIERYRQIYGFSPGAPLDAERIRAHWDLELRLADDIIRSAPEQRAKVAEDAYTSLYEELCWHDEMEKDPESPREWSDWMRIIGDTPLDIYEVGSGRAELLRELAAAGHRCTGTEITSERGRRYDEDAQLAWAATDGVHLDRFEEPSSYDLVLSNQVIEHLHPDDLAAHLASALALLRPGGRYVLSVPHHLTGPHDVSEVFGRLEAEAMHLKEYSWTEVATAMRTAGYVDVGAVSLVRVEPLLDRVGLATPGVRRVLARGYLGAMRLLEGALSRLPDRARQQRWSRSLKERKVFADNIFVVGHRGSG